MASGKFVVIEGTDGSGKTTQFKKLLERLQMEKFPIATFDFPQYGKPSAYFVEQYLNGNYGGIENADDKSNALFEMSGISSVGPEAAALLYAVDRFDVAGAMHAAKISGKLVLVNRYVTSNMGHQGAKIAKKSERLKFFKWIEHIEFDIFQIPKPDLTLILHVPAAIAQHLVEQKGSRDYIGGVKKDLHEKNLPHLQKAENTYLEIAALYPEHCKIVECMDAGRLLSVDEIHERVWSALQPALTPNP